MFQASNDYIDWYNYDRPQVKL
ncbi:IS3 family transposase [Lactococcus lactis]